MVCYSIFNHGDNNNDPFFSPIFSHTLGEIFSWIELRKPKPEKSLRNECLLPYFYSCLWLWWMKFWPSYQFILAYKSSWCGTLSLSRTFTKYHTHIGIHSSFKYMAKLAVRGMGKPLWTKEGNHEFHTKFCWPSKQHKARLNSVPPQQNTFLA